MYNFSFKCPKQTTKERIVQQCQDITVKDLFLSQIVINKKGTHPSKVDVYLSTRQKPLEVLVKYQTIGHRFPDDPEIDTLIVSAKFRDLVGMPDVTSLYMNDVDSLVGMSTRLKSLHLGVVIEDDVLKSTNLCTLTTLDNISPSLEGLFIYGSDLRNIDALTTLTNLSKLSLTVRCTDELDFVEQMTRLTDLSISFLDDTQLEDLAFTRLVNLKRLVVRGDVYGSTPQYNDNLVTLNLAYTQIDKANNLEILTNLVRLDLPHTIKRLGPLPSNLVGFLCKSRRIKLDNIPKTMKQLFLVESAVIGEFSHDPMNMLIGSTSARDWRKKRLEEYNRQRKCLGLEPIERVNSTARFLGDETAASVCKRYNIWRYQLDGLEYQEAVNEMGLGDSPDGGCDADHSD